MTTVTAEARRVRRVRPEPVVPQVLPALAVQRAQPVVAALEARAVAPVARAPRARQVLQAPRVRLAQPAQRVQRARVAAMKPTPARMRRTPRNRVSVGGLVRRGPVFVGGLARDPVFVGGLARGSRAITTQIAGATAEHRVPPFRCGTRCCVSEA